MSQFVTGEGQEHVMSHFYIFLSYETLKLKVIFNFLLYRMHTDRRENGQKPHWPPDKNSRELRQTPCKDICMYACVYVCMHTYACIHLRIYMHTCMYVCIHTFMHAFIKLPCMYCSHVLPSQRKNPTELKEK